MIMTDSILKNTMCFSLPQSNSKFVFLYTKTLCYRKSDRFGRQTTKSFRVPGGTSRWSHIET